MKLIFENSFKEERVIADVNNVTEIFNEINKFLDERNFKSDYSRVWFNDGRMVIDVGSHTEFFLVDGYSEEEWIADQEKMAMSE